MAKLKVLRAIEYNGKLYLPEAGDAPKLARSAGNGGDIPVDASGGIDLTEEQAAELTLGQTAPLLESGNQQPARKSGAAKK